ncbi:hypothetical protein BKA62DRAFT_770004 [Auriculariales sp. MPI-PUGE-AT-0066]|nr:hypothetical protein BKA62DRAFT_770004 [Auriculariales sp. MPI-PUGE-AT-0066]
MSNSSELSLPTMRFFTNQRERGGAPALHTNRTTSRQGVLTIISVALLVPPAASEYSSAIACDVGCLQRKGDAMCYYPNVDVPAYTQAVECDIALLSGALHNHMDTGMHPQAPSTAYYDTSLRFVGDAAWELPNDTSEFIACYQGPLPLRDDHGRTLFHTWCHFVINNNDFSFAKARENHSLCSRVHINGIRAEADGCVSPQ